MKMLKKLVKFLLPRGAKQRVIPFRLAQGVKAVIDFEYDAGFYLGRHERELFPHYKRLVIPGTKCFDIGGFRG